jgi:hypothetical protein
MPAESHAILGASSASRWINCPGSVNAAAAMPSRDEEKTSLYADEGTAAHNLAEHCLTARELPENLIGATVRGKIQEWPITEEMAEAVHLYIDEVDYHVSRFGGPSKVHVDIERSVKPLPDRDDLWGTADVMIYEPFGELVVLDFKYGRGIVVEVEWNDQMMFYGLGALQEIGVQDVSTVTIVVVQPRAPHPDGPVRRWTVGTDVLLEFADNLSAAADLTADPEAPLRAGDHCRFCPAAVPCPEMNRLRLQTAATDFDNLPAEIEQPAAHVRLPNPADPEELAKAMKIIPLLEYWSKEVHGYVHAELERGVEIPGWKLVRGRANRAWRDSADVERRLKNKTGVRVDKIYKRTLQTPAQIEKVVGKDWVARHSHKPEGKLTVAPANDSRPAEKPSMISDFEDSTQLEELL